jgi:hypothetical protein
VQVGIAVTGLPRRAARGLWEDFAEAIGPEATRRAYGPSWPRDGVEGELLYVFERDGQRAAWMSLRADPVEPWAWYAAGVWPAFQRAGVVHQVRACAVDIARVRWPHVGGLLIEVLDSNRGWQEALLREADAARSELRRAGRLEVPGAEAQLFWIPTKGSDVANDR